MKKPPPGLILLFLFYFFLIAGGQISASLAAKAGGVINIYTGFLYLFFLTRSLLWLYILKEVPLTTAYTLTSLNYIIIPLISTFFLKESYSLKYLGGSILIISGILLFTGIPGRGTEVE